jgi:hypothetical protein
MATADGLRTPNVTLRLAAALPAAVTASATRFASKAPRELDVDRLDGHLVNTHAAALREHEQFGAAPW